MERAKLDGADLAYEVIGSGEPLLLIGTGPIADSFLPLLSQAVLTDVYALIRYHQRGQVEGAEGGGQASFAEHARDAAALLDHLGVATAHVAGHSTGGDIALQLAFERPERVHSLLLLEPALFDVPSGATFLGGAEPALAAYAAGDRDSAMSLFLSLVSGLPWETCRSLIDRAIPGGAARAIREADTFFAGYLPALQAWRFTGADAERISCPVLSVLGTESARLFVEGRDLIHAWFQRAEDADVPGAGHLLHVQRPEPVASAMAAFLRRHPMRGSREIVPDEEVGATPATPARTR